jgi:hypothetical protein
MPGYRNLYGGPDYVLHFRFATMLNTIYIAMLFGLGIPILVPLAALRFFNIYVSERIMVAYMAKQPPSLDDNLTRNARLWLKWSPALLLLNGFWMLSNRQIFHNEWNLVDVFKGNMVSSHTLQFGTSSWNQLLIIVIIPFFYK